MKFSLSLEFDTDVLGVVKEAGQRVAVAKPVGNGASINKLTEVTPGPALDGGYYNLNEHSIFGPFRKSNSVFPIAIGSYAVSSPQVVRLHDVVHQQLRLAAVRLRKPDDYYRNYRNHQLG